MPQVSVLGPILFILCINDVYDAYRVFDCILLAIDTNLICSAYDTKDLCRVFNVALHKLCNWFSINKLSFNIQKTHYILLGHKANDENLSVLTNNKITYRV